MSQILDKKMTMINCTKLPPSFSSCLSRDIAAIENPQDIIVQSIRPYGQIAVLPEMLILISCYDPMKQCSINLDSKKRGIFDASLQMVLLCGFDGFGSLNGFSIWHAYMIFSDCFDGLKVLLLIQ